MTLQECYEKLGGDYAAVSARLPSEKFIQKYVLKFADDKTMELLESSFAGGDYDEAFRAAHTIKGMCQNLGFNTLLASSAELTEALRSGLTPEAGPLCERVKEDYGRTVTAIRSFQEGMST